MKKKAIEATVEELIKDLSSDEDIDSILQIGHERGGMIVVADHEWSRVAEGPTLREALLEFGKSHWRTDQEFSILDWS